MSIIRSFIVLMSSLGCLAFLFACSTPQSTNTSNQEAATVEIDKQVHFLTPDGEDVVVSPGAYEVKIEKDGLRLIAEEGTGSESTVIDAEAAKHEESVTHPTAMMLSEEEDRQIITLLLPDGQRWEALGSESGVHSRAARRPRTASSQIKQHLTIRNKINLLRPQLTLSTVSVKYRGEKKTHHGRKSKSTWRLPVNDTHNSGSFTFSWAGYPGNRTLVPSKIGDIQNLVKRKQCCIKVLINGKETPAPRMSFGKSGTLQTTIQLSQARAKTWPKTVKVMVTKGQRKWESAVTKIYATPVSYYASVLHQIFSHDRCTTCHTLGTHDKIVEMHQTRLGAASYPHENNPEAKPHNPTFCGTCHNAANLNNEWFSPSASQGINWKGWNASQVCHKVTGPFKNKDGVVEPPFDHARFDHHFHDDPRILWAVSDGMTPFGNDLNVPLPDNLNAWFNKVDPWVDAGTPCPTYSKFSHRNRGTLPRNLVPQR